MDGWLGRDGDGHQVRQDAPLCVKDGSTVFGNITAAKGSHLYRRQEGQGGRRNLGRRDIRFTSRRVRVDHVREDQSAAAPWCRVPSSRARSRQINLNNVNNNYDPAAAAGCPASGAAGQDCCRTPARSAAGYTALTTLQTLLTVTDDKGNPASCSKGGKFCDYDESKGNLTIDDKGSVLVNQGQYCLNSVNIKSPLELQYDAVAKNVAPIQWNVKGLVKLRQGGKGKVGQESENDPWLFMILSSCNARRAAQRQGHRSEDRDEDRRRRAVRLPLRTGGRGEAQR